MKRTVILASMRGKHQENSALQRPHQKQVLRVFVRLRPLVEGYKLGSKSKWKYNKKAILEDTGSGTKTQTFDGVLPPNTTNAQAYRILSQKN